MPWVEKKGDRYKAVIRTPKGKHSKTFDRRKHATAWLAQQEHLLATGQQIQMLKTSVAEFSEVWVESLSPTWRPSTLQSHRTSLRVHILPTLGHLPVAGVTPLDVSGWLAEQKNKGLSLATVARHRNVLFSLFELATEFGLAAKNPVKAIPPPKLSPRGDDRILNSEQILELADAINVRVKGLVLVMGFCGLRVSEALALTPESIGSTIQVRGSVVHPTGERPRVAELKSKSSARSVGVPKMIEQPLLDLVDEYSVPGIAFPTKRGTHMNRSAVGRAIRSASAELGEMVSPHDLRHSAVSIWIAAGGNPKLISSRAGHSSVAFTLDRYGHLFPDADQRFTDDFDTYLANL